MTAEGGLVGAIKRANATRKPEESVPLRVAVLVAVLAATSATLANGVGGASLRLAATAGIALGFAYSHRARERDSYLLKAGLAIGVVIAFGGFLRSLSGVEAGLFLQVQIPLAELFLWVQVLHSLDVPARRDLHFSLLSSFVLIGVAGVLSRSSGLLVYVVVWGAAAVVALALSYRSALAELPAVGHRSRAPGTVRLSRPSASRIVTVAVLLVVVSIGALFLVPSAGAGRAVAFPAELARVVPVPNAGGLANPSLGAEGDPSGGDDPSSPDRTSFGYFGFASSLDTSVRGRPDNTLVMRVRAERPDFWRGQSFDSWDGRIWRQTDDEPTTVRGFSPIDIPPTVEDSLVGLNRGEDFVQTVYVERSGPNLIFAAYAPAQLYFSDRTVFQLSDGTVRTGVQLDQGAVYTVVSRRHTVTADDLRRSDTAPVGLPPHLDARYTQLPGVPSRVTDLAARVAAGAPTTYDKVLALEDWMATNTTYTLDIPPLPPGADAVEQFLFVDRQGFCEQIATSLVVMLRSLGIPARLTAGYVPGQRNPFTGLYEVRGSDAHAWAEVWFPGIGWQAFDPTASVPLSGDSVPSSAGAGLFRYLGAHLPGMPDWGQEAATASLALTGLVGAGVMLRRWAAARRRAAARAWADRMLDDLEALGRTHGRPRRPAESATRYAAALRRTALDDDRIVRVGAAIDADAFGGEPHDTDARAWVESVLTNLRQ